MKSGKGFSIAALICGIVSIILAWWYMVNIAAIICGVLGLVFAVIGSKRSKAAGEPTGLATAGLVLSIIGLVFALIGFLACTVCVCACGGALKKAANDLSSYTY
ncbi:MAG: hypothetical protein J5950_04935 [Clostridia bacterium]|nr:hypothetical protein [Clostridia bacterium]